MTRRLQFATKQKSISYFRSARFRSEQDPRGGLYSHMFIEDISHKIMPIGGNSKNHPDFSVILDPASPSDENILRVAFSIHDYVKYTLREAVSTFITDCAMYLAYKGEIHYEIVRCDLKDFKQKIGLQHIELPVATTRLFQPVYMPGNILGIAGYYFQLIPKAEWASQKKLMVAIPANSVWFIRLPPQFGNPSSHARLLKTLVRYNAPLPKFIKFDPKDNSSRRNFSFSDFHKYSDLRIAMETALWGWPARQLFEKSMLEYHFVYRHLRFAHSMAILREHILLSTNDLLRRIGFVSHLSITGLPTSRDLQEAIYQLELGEISFDDALALTNLL